MYYTGQDLKVNMRIFRWVYIICKNVSSKYRFLYMYYIAREKPIYQQFVYFNIELWGKCDKKIICNCEILMREGGQRRDGWGCISFDPVYLLQLTSSKRANR